jgi:hypothetical protein
MDKVDRGSGLLGDASCTPQGQSIWSLIRVTTPAGAKLLRLDIGETQDRRECGWDNLVSANWRGDDGGALPAADGVVLDGGVASLLAVSPDHAAASIRDLLKRYGFIILDLSSWTESPEAAGWRAACGGIHRTDLALRRAVLGECGSIFKLGRIAVNGGVRTVYKVYGEAVTTRGLVPVQSFQRNHASWPLDKRLVENGALSTADAADHVTFARAINADGDQFWIKTYLRPDGPRIAALEQSIGLQAVEALDRLRRLQPHRAAMLDLMLPIAVEGPSLIFPYDPDAIGAGPSHLQDWSHFLPAEVMRSVSILAALHVPFLQLPSISLHNLCDFQVISQASEATILDFEPNPWVLALMT